MSAQLCGCDPEANHRCLEHSFSLRPEEELEALKSVVVHNTYDQETIHTDPTTGGQKGRKLARFSLLPWDALWLVAEHFGRGAKKYADHNWAKGYPWSWSYDALQRHLAAFWHGEDYGDDPKLGRFLHIVAVAWHALVLTAFAIRKSGTDDRPTGANIKESV